MIDIKLLREKPEEVERRLKSRGVEIDAHKILTIDEHRRDLIKKTEDLKAMKNEASKKISVAAPAEKQKLIDDLKIFDADADRFAKKLAEVEEDFLTVMRELPNLPMPDVKVGKDENDNEVLRHVGEPRKFDFKPRDHFEIGEKLGIIDMERAGKVSGSRFGYLIGAGAMLEFALLHYAMHHLTESGFKPVVPPVLINRDSMAAMGYLEHGGNQEIYHLDQDDLFLIGTSEQSIGPMHRDEILDEKNLPLRYAGFSTCFRREAGAAGKDTRGLFRVHQFNKIEMFSFCPPEKSEAEHEFLLAIEEKLMQGLGLPYRVLKLCTGDIGRPSARTYDIEAWFPSQNTYRETHSTSTCTDYQARRLMTRMRDKAGNVKVLHTLNGTVFSGRPLLAILENGQQADGSVVIPEALHQYLGKSILKPV